MKQTLQGAITSEPKLYRAALCTHQQNRKDAGSEKQSFNNIS